MLTTLMCLLGRALTTCRYFFRTTAGGCRIATRFDGKLPKSPPTVLCALAEHLPLLLNNSGVCTTVFSGSLSRCLPHVQRSGAAGMDVFCFFDSTQVPTNDLMRQYIYIYIHRPARRTPLPPPAAACSHTPPLKRSLARTIRTTSARTFRPWRNIGTTITRR